MSFDKGEFIVIDKDIISQGADKAKEIQKTPSGRKFDQMGFS